MPATSATAMIRYFQRGYRFMAGKWSQRLDRALGEKLRDCAPLHHDFGSRGDFERQILIANLRDAAEDPARGDDLVALLERLQHRLRFLGLFLLRADEQEIENDE